MRNFQWTLGIVLAVELTAASLAGVLVPAKASAAAPAEGESVGSIKSDPARLGRIRAARMPKITDPVMFYTAQADAICSALEIFPRDNPWNQVIEDWPLHPDSDAIITSIGKEKPFRCNMDMSFILVPPDQKRVNVKIVGYPGESDPGPYPVPDNVPIESSSPWLGIRSRAFAGHLRQTRTTEFSGLVT